MFILVFVVMIAVVVDFVFVLILGGGILLYVREHIPSNILTVETKPIEGFSVELNLRNGKWLINCSYNPHKIMIGSHLGAFCENLDLHSSNYEKCFTLRDFSAEMENQEN